ncbi:MAG: ABC transporter permease [Blautia sp.]|nr:ABC transporter permease [Blautia sp.]
MNELNNKTRHGGRSGSIGTAARALLVILIVMLAVFFLIRLVPGDPAVMILGEHATEESLQALRERLGLDLPVSAQFLRFLKNIFTKGDTGESLKYGVSCRQLVLQYAPVSLALTGMAMLITVVMTILLAYLAALHKDGLFDHLVRLVPAFTQGMPVFWTGLLFILFFSVRLRWFPVGGLGEGVGGMIHSLILPAITVSFGQIPPLVRSLRERLLEVLSADFVTMLRAAKVPSRRILMGHVLRNAFVPTLMLFSVNLSYMIGGTLVVEQVFGIRGIGKLLFEAISNRDFPLVQAIALYCAVFVVAISLITELIARKADPRGEVKA